MIGRPGLQPLHTLLAALIQSSFKLSHFGLECQPLFLNPVYLWGRSSILWSNIGPLICGCINLRCLHSISSRLQTLVDIASLIKLPVHFLVLSIWLLTFHSPSLLLLNCEFLLQSEPLLFHLLLIHLIWSIVFLDEPTSNITVKRLRVWPLLLLLLLILKAHCKLVSIVLKYLMFNPIYGAVSVPYFLNHCYFLLFALQFLTLTIHESGSLVILFFLFHEYFLCFAVIGF